MPHIISQKPEREIFVVYVRAFFLVFESFFAVLGVYFLLSFVLDRLCEKRVKARCIVLVEEADEREIEYLVRFLESRFVNGEFGGIFSGIGISKTVICDKEKLKPLAQEFKNIHFL